MLAVLTGGTGGAKLIRGLSLEVEPRDLVIICNTADDLVLYGLHVSPDLDTITYTLAGLADEEKGWGIKGDTFAVLEQMREYGWQTWFRLGDRDLGTHLTRSAFLREGSSLSQATDRIRTALGVKASILPMSDDRVETRIVTPRGEIPFQEFFVRDRWSDEIERVYFAGAERSRPAPGVIEAIRGAAGIVVCPSNPVTSIGPILAVPGVRAALREVERPIVAVSPVIGGVAISGPAAKLMASAGIEVSAFGVAKAYADFIDTVVVAREDEGLGVRIAGLGLRAVATDILMNNLADKRRLAHEVLALLGPMC
ncbi:MAG: 2-phospho-L-lactate transferase [Deltaproteobacteria bacterium]|nr:2-phospho-L-lactate transferase [Deltaproteobacteria bacterium]